ncbi:hypothetical protein BX666DRAFT_1991829 [Dichotomocladium elegans]|nr:hypothetical protein BX666DRAFT_1991829 [Dichotomocladium elegans]
MMTHYYQQPQQHPYNRKSKPLPEIPQQDPLFFPVDHYYYAGYPKNSLHSFGLPASGGPPASLLPPSQPPSLYRQPSRRHSYADIHQMLPVSEYAPHGYRRLSVEVPHPFESLKIEQDEKEDADGQQMPTSDVHSHRPPPSTAQVLLEKPFDPALAAPNHHHHEHHSPNTPDDQSVGPKVPSPRGSMVSLYCTTDIAARQAHSSNGQSPGGSSSHPTTPCSSQNSESALHSLLPPTVPAQSTPPPPPPPPSPPGDSSMTAQGLSATIGSETIPTSNDMDTEANVLDPYKKPHFTSIASYSLTHNKETLRTLRRMAIKTRSAKVQMAYAKYLLDITRLYPTLPSRQRIWDEARYWILRLYKSIPEARYIKGQWHLEENKTAKALRCFERAAKDGYMAAYVDLAEHAKRQGDWHKALAYYRSADGHAEANYKMAMLLIRNKQINEGICLLQKAAAEPHSSGKPALVLSMIYSHRQKETKTKVNRNDVLALRYLKQAVQAGLVDAVHRMGEVYTHGELGQPKDPWQGYQCFMKAADEYHPMAMLELAKLYARGIRGFLNAQPQCAFRWCQRAAERGLTEAEYTLGTYYEEGVGVRVDYARALECFGKAASKGYTPAAEKLNQPISLSSIRSSKGGDLHSPNCHIM